jgi:hypothetical protein
MSFILQPWHIMLAVLCGLVNKRQQQIIEFQNAQIEALLEKFGGKRVLLTADQRRLLAVKGHALGRKALLELTTIVTPDTILRWHRTLVAKKWDYAHKRKPVGRPRIRQVIVDLILRFATENPTWGYDRIPGALAHVGYYISDSTVGNVLKTHGIEPTEDRKRQTTWATFLKAHWDVLGAIDFTTVEVWTKKGLVKSEPLLARSFVVNASAGCSSITTATRRRHHFLGSDCQLRLAAGARRAVKLRRFSDHCPSRSPASRPRSARAAFTNPGFQGSRSSFEFFDLTA